MNENHERAIFVVIEPDPSKRAEIADRIQQDDPLQLLFFETSAHARAFLDRMPLGDGIRLEVRERNESRHEEREGVHMATMTADYLRQSAVRARAVAKSASAKANHIYLEALATRFEEQALEFERRTAANKPTLRSAPGELLRETMD